ncbi:hypothetical protein BH24BAC1_BH24BAC1_03160 [soil metagenome]
MTRIALYFATFCFLCPLAWAPPAGAQQRQALTVKAFGLSYHLKPARNPDLFPNRLDKQGLAVLNYGLLTGYDRYVYREVLHVRVQQGLYADCTASFAGFWHLGWRARLLQAGRHTLNGGIGPTLVFRRDWNRIPGYEDDGYFRQGRGWQYKFYWYAGELEYNFRVNQKSEFSLTLVPGLPELVSFGFGIRRFL